MRPGWGCRAGTLAARQEDLLRCWLPDARASSRRQRFGGRASPPLTVRPTRRPFRDALQGGRRASGRRGRARHGDHRAHRPARHVRPAAQAMCVGVLADGWGGRSACAASGAKHGASTSRHQGHRATRRQACSKGAGRSMVEALGRGCRAAAAAAAATAAAAAAAAATASCFLMPWNGRDGPAGARSATRCDSVRRRQPTRLP